MEDPGSHTADMTPVLASCEIEGDHLDDCLTQFREIVTRCEAAGEIVDLSPVGPVLPVDEHPVLAIGHGLQPRPAGWRLGTWKT